MIPRERRRSQRFLMRLPLTIRWIENNLHREARTETRDVSSRGIRFTLPKGPGNDSVVEIVMIFPHRLTHAGPVRLDCRGRIVRTDLEHGDEMEVAAAIERFEFAREDETAA
jgi:PilZ domain